MKSQGHSPTQNITSATSSKALLGCPICRKWVHMAFCHPETYLHQLQQSRFLRRSERILWVLKSISITETSLQRLRPSRFTRCPGRKKWIRITFRHLEITLHRHQQSRFLRRQECRLWVAGAICLLKTSLRSLRQNRFSWMPRSLKMSSHGQPTPWNIGSSTSRRPEGRL
jgi:hypothetical protein